MTQAGRSGAAYALIIGDKELNEGSVIVRDLKTGEETSVDRGSAVSVVREKVRP